MTKSVEVVFWIQASIVCSIGDNDRPIFALMMLFEGVPRTTFRIEPASSSLTMKFRSDAVNSGSLASLVMEYIIEGLTQNTSFSIPAGTRSIPRLGTAS